MSGTCPDPATAREHLAAARRVRGAWLLALSESRATWPELVAAATRDTGRPLRTIRLSQVAGCTRRPWPPGVLRRWARFDGPDRGMTLGWVLRAGVRTDRLSAVADSLADRIGSVDGFPFRVPDDLGEVWAA